MHDISIIVSIAKCVILRNDIIGMQYIMSHIEASKYMEMISLPVYSVRV